MAKRAAAQTDGIRVVRKKLSDYRQIANNPTGHNPRNVGTIVSSIQQVGAGRSGLASGGEILAGNATWEAMAEAGIEDVIEITTTGHEWVLVNRPDLTEEQKRFAAHADQRSALLADIDPETLQLDLDAGVDLSALYRDNEISELLGQAGDERASGLGDVPEEEEDPPAEPLQRSDVPDALWPSDNEWGVPLLDITMQADAVDLPVVKWGTIARTSKMRGTWSTFTDDYKMNALWDDPSKIVNTGCVNIIEPNWSTGPTMPRALALWGVYRKRWLSRYWQSKGIRIFVDMNVEEAFADLNMLGVPRGWRAYATRWLDKAAEAVSWHYARARAHAGEGSVLFVVVGGREAAKLKCREMGWVWIPEDSARARDEEVTHAT